MASTDIADPESEEREDQQITFDTGPSFEVTGGMDTELDEISFPAL